MNDNANFSLLLKVGNFLKLSKKGKKVKLLKEKKIVELSIATFKDFFLEVSVPDGAQSFFSLSFFFFLKVVVYVD